MICCSATVPTVLELGDIVVPRVAVDWKSIASDLELKEHTIAVIEQRCRNDPRSCCMQMLSEWVITEQGVSPKTWATLLFIIKQTRKLVSACSDIENDLANLPMYVIIHNIHNFNMLLFLSLVQLSQNQTHTRKVCKYEEFYC